MALEATLVVAVLGLFGPRVAAVRISGPVVPAVCLVLFSWVCAFCIRLSIFYAVSWDDFPDLLLASLRASAPAMWFAPAILLITTPSRAAMAIGLLLVANTTRLVVARAAPRKLAPTGAAGSPRRYRMFRYALLPEVSLTREILPAVLGALAMESGLCGIWLGRPIYAAVFMGCGAAMWTWCSIAQGAMERRDETRPSHWLLSILLTLLLSIFLSVTQIRIQARMNGVTEDDSSLVDTAQQLWQELQEAPTPKEPALPAAANTTRIVNRPRPKGAGKKGIRAKEIAGSGNYQVPGVVVRPDVMPRRQVLAIPMTTRGRSSMGKIDRPLSFPFNGEYRLFPTSSANLQHEWAVEDGTLLQHVYITAGGGSLQTEAYQKFEAPFDFADCGKVRLVIGNEEEGPFSTAMKLVTADGTLDLGTQICGLERHREEALEFAVPESNHSLPVQAIRIDFSRMPRQGSESMKLVVREFTLSPRGH
jgi:hypothetical protein